MLGFGLSCLISAQSVQAQTQPPAPPAEEHAAPAARGDVPPNASPAEIVAARELFRLGTEDADAGRFEEGLEKFKRVAAVKETAAVRFNLARCEEALGQTGTALADFELAEREGRQDPRAEDVSKLAHDRADALRPRVPRLTLILPSPPPQGMVVSLDGGKLASATLGVPLPLDPGSHVVDATAPASSSFHAELVLGAGEAKNLTLAFPSYASDTNDSLAARAELASASRRKWGWIAVAAGGVLAVGSGLFLIFHNDAVATVNTDCPNLRCPIAQQAQVLGAESDARTDQGVSIALLAASVVAVGGGAALLATSPGPKPSATPAVVVTGAAPGALAGLSIRGSF